MHVFWQKGFEGASLSDLIGAMDINKPSLYATFGNKEELFLKATDHYLTHHVGPLMARLEGKGSTLERMRDYLTAVIDAQALECNGCYITVCVNETATQALPKKAHAMVEKVRDHSQTHFQDFFARESEGRLSEDQCRNMALTTITFLHGTAAMTRGGMPAQALKPVIDGVLDLMAERLGEVSVA